MSYPGKGRADYYDEGGYNALCYECGRKRKASDLVKHWQGYYVCPEHWEARHPQDFVRGIKDIETPPWVQDAGYTLSTGVLGSVGGSLTGGGGNVPGTSIVNSGIIDVPMVVVDIPWNPAGSTITDFVLTDYVVPPATAGTVIVNIPDGTTINGSFTLGPTSVWPHGTTFIIHNHGIVKVIPTMPAGPGVTVNVVVSGVPLGVPVTNPTYTIQWQNGNFPPPVLVFDIQPTDAGANSSISPPIQVAVVGNLSVAITNVVFNIMLTIGINPGSPPGVLSGTLVQTTVNGVATFNDIQIDQPGNGYILIASVV